MGLGKRLTYQCEKRGLTIAALARLAAVPVQTLHGWTTGRKAVQLEQLRRVALVLQMSVHELAFGEPDPHDSFDGEILKELFTGDVRISIQRIERSRKRHI